MIKQLVVVGVVALLAGCMGSNDEGGLVEQNNEVTRLDDFSDGYVILRVLTDPSAVTRAVDGEAVSQRSAGTMVSTVRAPTADLSNQNPLSISSEDLTLYLTKPNGSIYTGILTLGDDEFDVRMFTEDGSDTYLVSALNMSDDTKWTVVTGASVSAMPTGGSFVYTGQNLVSNTDNTNAGGGSFTINVNFGTLSGDISAVSVSAGTSLTGEFTFDSDTGYLFGEGLILTAPIYEGESVAAVLEGSFHGNGASGVSALYYEDSDTPLVSGAVIGSGQAVD